MTKITLKNGFKVEVNEALLTDWRVTELYATMYDPDSTDSEVAIATVKLVDLIFGKNKKALLKSLENKKTGIIPAEKPAECLAEVLQKLEALESAKKS
jgi:hypothetical protein